MPTYPVDDFPYVGSLLAVNLFSGSTTLLLSVFGSSQSTSLVDDGTRLYVGENVLIGGGNYTVLGSGTAQPGINILGLTVPTGFPKDLVLVQDVDTGQLHMIFPDGVPNALGMIALVVTLQPIGYDLISNGPLRFAKGTLIDTTSGEVAVEDLQPGALLATPDGPPLRLLVNIRAKGDWISPSALLPVVIRKDAFGPNCPNHQLMVSQQHGMQAALVPAVGLVDFDAVTIGHNSGAIQFYHLLCDRHGVVYANGVAAETLLWSADMREGLDARAAIGHDAEFKPQSCCLPRLSVRETRRLMRGSNMLRPIVGAYKVCAA